MFAAFAVPNLALAMPDFEKPACYAQCPKRLDYVTDTHLRYKSLGELVPVRAAGAKLKLIQFAKPSSAPPNPPATRHLKAVQA